MVRPQEGMSQARVLLSLRAAIDTAIRYPHQGNVDTALEIARTYPRALASAHLRHNLGKRRWDWLAEHGVTP